MHQHKYVIYALSNSLLTLPLQLLQVTQEKLRQTELQLDELNGSSHRGQEQIQTRCQELQAQCVLQNLKIKELESQLAQRENQWNEKLGRLHVDNFEHD